MTLLIVALTTYSAGWVMGFITAYLATQTKLQKVKVPVKVYEKRN